MEQGRHPTEANNKGQRLQYHIQALSNVPAGQHRDVQYSLTHSKSGVVYTRVETSKSHLGYTHKSRKRGPKQ